MAEADVAARMVGIADIESVHVFPGDYRRWRERGFRLGKQSRMMLVSLAATPVVMATVFWILYVRKALNTYRSRDFPQPAWSKAPPPFAPSCRALP